MFLIKSKPASHEARILAHLKKVGHYGSFNYELARSSVGGLGYRSRITELRADGYNIQAVRIKSGIFKYYLNES